MTDLSLRPHERLAAPRAPWRRWLVRAAIIILALCALAYAAAIGYMWTRQESLLFAPDVLPPGHRFAVEDDVQEVSVDVPGAKLSALHLRLPNPRGVVFFLHGNTGSLERWFEDAHFFRRANFDVFMLDYRGYGKSSGHIESEAQLHSDVLAAWQSVAPQYEGKRRVILGRSLGTALAAQLAAAVKPDLTVLVSPYRSMEGLVGEMYPWVPSLALRYPLHTDDAVKQIRTPLLIVHGERDTFIKPAHARALAALSPEARLVLVPDAGHGNILSTAGYRSALRVQLNEH
jgi:alpha-beta hydrolase superfamily lysophospholipase